MNIIILIVVYSSNYNRNCNSNIGAKDNTPEIAKVKFRRRMPRRVHWKIPVEIHRASDNPLENGAESPRCDF